MIAKVGKRSIAFLLAVLMLISVAPVQAFATEGEHDHEHECAHEYVDEVTGPGCETPGFTTWTCTLCGDSYVTDEVDALCHNFEAGTPVAATPEAQGYTPYVCTLCGREEKADFVDYVAPASQEPEVEEPKVEEPEVEDEPVVDQEPEEYSYKWFQNFIDEMLDWYLVQECQLTVPEKKYPAQDEQGELVFPENPVEDEMTREEYEQWLTVLEEAVANMTPHQLENAAMEIRGLEYDMMDYLTEEECLALVEENLILCDVAHFVSEYAIELNLLATSGTFKVKNEEEKEVLQIDYTYSSGSATDNKNGTYTFTARSTFKLWGSGETNKVTIKNISGSKAKISFNWTASGSGSFTLTASPYTVTLDNNKTTTFTVTGDKSIGTEDKSVTISNIVCEEIIDNIDVPVSFDNTLGSVTANGQTVTNGGTVNVTTDGMDLVATAVSGVKFLGWVHASTNSILSTAATYTIMPVKNLSVKAVFAKEGENTVFGVGAVSSKEVSNGLGGLLGSTKSYYITPISICENLADAIAATDSSNKGIVLLNGGTLPAGDYTIPSGVTLLIPFDDANTLYNDSGVPASVRGEVWESPSKYRTLTMASGANLIVNGTLSLSAKHATGQGSRANGGSPSGPVSFINMNGGSITVNNGGKLFAYGFITGSGSVTAKSGATVYENFQIMDFRGGSQSTDMKNKVFPISQYYVQNIEVPLTLEYGATEKSYTSITMNSMDFGSSVAFIGQSGCMFNMSSGSSITKWYDGSTDRLMVEASGNFSMSPVTLDVGGTDINSKDYDLGINGNITVRVKSGSTISLDQHIALLPGAQIIVDEGATCKVGNNIRVYVYDADEWGGYCAPGNKTFIPVTYAPGRTYNRTDKDIVDASILVNGTIDASSGRVFTTAGGANIYSTGTGVANIYASSTTAESMPAYQIIQAGEPANSQYPQIPITTPKLKNADGSYRTTNKIITGQSMTFRYENGEWVAECEHPVENVIEGGKAATCTEPGYTAEKYCNKCGYIFTEGAEIPALGHTPGAVATCVEPQKCTVCHAVLADALGHNPGSAATCTTAQTCTRCDHVYETALGHKMVNATCETPKTCSVCGTTEGEALGHDMTNSQVVAPTCTEQGYTRTSCARSGCNHFEDSEFTNALDHDWNITYSATDITKVDQLTATRTCQRTGCGLKEEATATVQKVDTVEATCKVRGEVTYTADFEADWADDQTETVQTDTNPDNHKDVTILKAVAPTCETDGLTEGKHCNICNTDFVAQEVDPKLGHDWGEVTYIWNNNYYSCTATRACQRTGCGKTETLTQVADKEVTQEANCVDAEAGTAYAKFTEDWAKDQSHAYTGSTNSSNHKTVVNYAAVDSTCTEYGHEAGKRCNACGENISGGAQYTELRPHKYESVVTAPTCTKAGYTTYTCSYSDCPHSYTSDEVDSLGHTPGEAVVENKVDPDCTTSGSYDSVVYCTVETCKAQISRETVTVDALGHTKEVIPAVDPTCTETGLTAGVKCSVCDDVITAQEVVDALDHNIVIDKAVAPTCTETGLTQGQHCSRCDDVTVAQKVVEATGHSYDEGEVTTPATCETAGEMTFTCQNNGCNDSYTQPITALGHDPEIHEGKLPTCTEIGWYQYTTCKRDGCEYSTYNEISATGHTYKTVVTPPTCTEKGYTTHTCNCGESYVDTYVEANGHKEGDKDQDDMVAATCTTDGSYVEVTYCGNCGSEMERENITVPALNHSFTNYVSNNDATCEEDGTKTAKCDRCDETDTVNDEGSAKGHTNGTPIVENEVAATCTAEGSYDSVVKCSICGEELSREKMTTEKAAHTPAEAVVENEVAATCTAEGSYDSVIKCSGCGTELSRTTEKVPATNHKDTTETIPGKAATCTESGLTDGKKCTACDEVLVKQEVIEATGHTYENGVCHCGDIEGVTVSGTVTSFNSETDAVTVELYAEGEETAAYTATVTGNTASYSIEKVKAGTYTMKVSKANHVTREYAVTVEKEAVSQDVKICLIGDVNANGAVNGADYRAILNHVNETKLITDEYGFKCADVNSSGSVNGADYRAVLNHVKETKPLF